MLGWPMDLAATANQLKHATVDPSDRSGKNWLSQPSRVPVPGEGASPINFHTEKWDDFAEIPGTTDFWAKKLGIPFENTTPEIVGRLVGGLLGMAAPLIPGTKAFVRALREIALTPGPVGLSVQIGAINPKRVLSNFATTTPGRIVNQTNKNQGYTVNLATGEVPNSGLMMGKYANDDPRNFVLDEFRRSDAEEFAKKNKNALKRTDQYLGTWLNKAPEGDDKYYLDVSKRFPDDKIRNATKFGEKTGQKAGFNVTTGEEFPVGKWEEFIETPEFYSRMDKMYKKGGEYMSQFPAKQWWDMHGDSSFNRVYGEKNLPQVAGYMGSTAPNAAPTENTRTMSEYMRRFIKGERTIQPNWRVPEGTVSRNAGKKIGMEKGRRKNLVLSSQGRYEELGGNKVRSEAKALMGDPDAMVFDRHQVRLSEKPSEGVYAGTTEGVMPSERKKTPSALYDKLGDSFKKAAAKTGDNARDYSARVWVGIRETIKDNWELFGETYQKGSIQGPSKSYADIFDDLISEKAKKLGITVLEMEERLRKGDAELLSAILAAPAGMAIQEMVFSVDQPQA